MSASWYAVHGPNGDLSWRVTGPAEAVGAKLQLIPEKEGERLAYPNQGKYFPWRIKAILEDRKTVTINSEQAWRRFNSSTHKLWDLKTEYPAHEGSSAVFTRPMAWLAVHAIQLRKNGVRVLTEVDDNYLSPSQLNVMFQTAKTTDDDRDNHARSICSGDGIIVTTDYLRDVYYKQLRDYFPRMPIPEIYVCRNHVDDRYLPTPIPREGPLRVGYMGSDSHVWDVDLIYPALAAAKELGCEIHFIGISPAHINPKYKRKDWDWAALDYTFTPWSLDFRGTALPLDIGLAPLLTNKHTMCKSDIKVLEYAMSGAACVAQNNLVYNRTLKHREHCLFAGSPFEFMAQTMALIRDEQLRTSLVDNTMQYVREERLLRNNVGEWEAAIYG